LSKPQKLLVRGQLASVEAVPESKLSVRHKISTAYLASIWLTSQYAVPFGDFERIPFYVVFTAVMYVFLPLRAMLCGFLLLLVLGGYEVLKSVQTDFEFTSKGILGLMAFSCVMSTAYFSLKQLGDLSASQLGNWVRLIILIMAGGAALEIFLTLAALHQPIYQNYVLPIPAFSGIFTEPSHLGMALAPFVFMLFFGFAALRRHVGAWYIALIGVVALLCPSATLIGITALAACISFSANALRMKIGGLAGVVALGSAVAIAILPVPEISDRVFGVLSANAYDPLGEQNLSSLLFEKGKQMAEYSLRNFPLGVAFLNMAILAPYAPVSYLADIVFYLNSQDGSSILFKGICEMGFLFIVFAVASFIRFFNAASRPKSFESLVFLAFQFAFFAHFIRAGSYFHGCLAIGLSACIFDLLTSERLQRIRNMRLITRTPVVRWRSAQTAFRP
jgi:hypothetical protein